MDHSFVGLVVQVYEVWFPLFLWECLWVDCVAVVLGCDVALARGQVHCWDVVCSVTVLQLVCLAAGGQGQQLVAQTDTEDGQLLQVLVGQQLLQVLDGLVAGLRVARPIR